MGTHWHLSLARNGLGAPLPMLRSTCHCLHGMRMRRALIAILASSLPGLVGPIVPHPLLPTRACLHPFPVQRPRRSLSPFSHDLVQLAALGLDLPVVSAMIADRVCVRVRAFPPGSALPFPSSPPCPSFPAFPFIARSRW